MSCASVSKGLFSFLDVRWSMFVYESANVKFQNQYKDSILDKTVGKVEKIFSFRLKIFVERFNKGFFVSLCINKMKFFVLKNK